MENVRISFEVPNVGGYTVKTLTDMARHFVMGLVSSTAKEIADEDIANAVGRAIPSRTDEEMAMELDRRWEHYLQQPETAVPQGKVVETVMSRICAE